MAKEPIEATVTDLAETADEATSRLQRFRLNHPRTAQVVGIATVTLATLGAVKLIQNRRQIVAELTDGESDDSFDTSSEIA